MHNRTSPDTPMREGPLRGYRVIELGGMGPGPFASMLLSELGAEVLRIDRNDNSGGGYPSDPRLDSLNRGKFSLGLNLKDPQAADVLLSMVEQADIVIDPFRPGVAERLGVGPDACLARNPKIIFARMTGWGQTGPASTLAGHDINYIGLTGALHAIGEPEGPPTVPLNLVGDFGGGANYLLIGILAALIEVQRTGRGQVIDAAIVDGVSHLLTSIHGLMAGSRWEDQRGSNILDGGAPFYRVYETSDAKHMAVGAIEPKFYAGLIRVLGVDVDLAQQLNQSLWPAATELFAQKFLNRTQDEWISAFEGVDACVTPVRSLTEAAADPHIASRKAITDASGYLVSAPAPRFSLYETGNQVPPPYPGQDTASVLRRWNIPGVDELIAQGVAFQNDDVDLE